MPSLSRARAKAQAIVCLNNIKQLQLAWIIYVEDHNDWLVPNNPPNYGGGTLPTWAKGDIRYGNPDGTNVDYIIAQHEGSLGPYVKTERSSNARQIDRSPSSPTRIPIPECAVTA